MMEEILFSNEGKEDTFALRGKKLHRNFFMEKFMFKGKIGQIKNPIKLLLSCTICTLQDNIDLRGVLFRGVF